LGLILQISVANLWFVPERLKRAIFTPFRDPCEPSGPRKVEMSPFGHFQAFSGP
jgi:hypothetical protein